MKVVNKKIWWAFSCRKCEAELEAKPSDVEYDFFGGITRKKSESRYYIECPECGEWHFVPLKKMTGKIERMAEKPWDI